jgi:3-dehydroquinate synthase
VEPPRSLSLSCGVHPVTLTATFEGGKDGFLAAIDGRPIFICTERRLAKILAPLVSHMMEWCPGAVLVTFPAGERLKTRASKERLEDRLLESGADRRSLLVVLGGGVVTDLVGFTAGTYQRGIPFVSVPTSLVAMEDAAIGGKTGVNTTRGKNLVGLFHPPAAVIAPLDTLETLPGREFRAGLAECLKHGLIADSAYFAWLAARSPARIRRDPEALWQMVSTSMTIKCRVVGEDPLERSGRRNILNVGHTVGHALERLSDYRTGHGDAVASGLLWEAAAAVLEGHLRKEDLDAIAEVMGTYGFPGLWREADPDRLAEAARWDKKNRSSKIAYVPLAGLGRVALPPPHTTDLTPGLLREARILLEGR